MARAFTSYKQHPPQGAFDAIVIGSGIGGLGTAAILSKLAGKRVLVLERHYTAGGFTHSFHRPGYEWDVGVHYVGQVGARRGQLAPFFDYVTDGALKWAPLPEVYDRIRIGDRSYDFVSGRDRFADRMKQYFPHEARAIDRYLELLSQVMRKSTAFFGERALPRWAAFFAGPFLRWPYMRFAKRTTAEVLASLTSNKELIAVLAGQYGNYGLPPGYASFAMHAAVVTHYLEGAYFPVGGGAAIAEAIEPVIAKSGGAIVTNAEVSEVIVRRGRAVGVKMADGAELMAPIVVSDAGARLTYEKLMPGNTASRSFKRALAKIPPSESHAALYVGLKHTDAELGLDGTNIWVYPGPDHDACAERFRDDFEAPFPLVYISFPSAKDPSFASRYPGRAAIDVIAPAPWSRFAAFDDTRWKKRGAEYDAFKEKISERLLTTLYENVPSVRGKIDVHELSTPLSTRHFAAHPAGEIYGLAHTPSRYRLPMRAETNVRGLYLTGTDLVSCGVAGALFGGVVAATAILKKNVPYAIVETHMRARLAASRARAAALTPPAPTIEK